MAWPCGLKIPPFTFSKSPPSIPALRGIEPTSNAQLVPSNAVFEIRGGLIPAAAETRSRPAPSDATEGLHRRLDLKQPQHHRLVGAQQLPGSNTKEDRVADWPAGPVTVT